MLAPVLQDLEIVSRRVRDLAEDAYTMLEGAARVLTGRPGKLIRPSLVLLSGLAGPVRDQAGRARVRRRILGAATAFELLHLASLTHDDIIDGADLRRGQVSVWKEWGVSTALLLGDHLYGRAVAQASLAGRRASRSLCRVIRALIRGQALEMRMAREAFSRRAYARIATAKTAVFASECCGLGALLAGAGRDRATALRGYGLALGQAYQLVDDLLDWLGDPAETGKPLLQDLAAGRFTLPLIAGLARRPARVGKLVADARSDQAVLAELRSELEATGAFEETRRLARAKTQRARRWLEILPRGVPRDNLDGLADILLERRF